jgi:DNA-binding NarL/FixJ family response regulator
MGMPDSICSGALRAEAGLTVLLIGYDQMVWQALERQLESHPRACTVHSASGIDPQGLELSARLPVDVAIVDITGQQTLAALEKVKQLQATRAEMRLLILTHQTSRMAVLQLLRVGVAGIVDKAHASLTELSQALLHVEINGNRHVYLSRTIDADLQIELETRPQSSMLTRREREVLAHAIRGATTPETAFQLGISERTVHAFLDILKRKLGVRTKHELIVRALELGLD